MMRPAIVALTPGGLDLARRIASSVEGAIHGREERASGADIVFSDTMAHVAQLFREGRPVIGICAAGILIRAVAPLMSDKRVEPPVVAVAEDGSAVIPLLGGHRGANDLSRRIAAVLGVTPSITTASDRVLGVALEEPPVGYRLANPDHAGAFAARLLGGEAVRIAGRAPWVDAASIVHEPEARLEIRITDESDPGAPDRLVYHPATLAVGVGAERGADPEEAVRLVRDAVESAGLAPASVALVASLDLKEDEAAVQSVSESFNISSRFFTAEQLETETPRLANPSDVVFRAVGCHGVAEAAALAAAGPGGVLVVDKLVGRGVTCAIARAGGPIDPSMVGRARARLAIVGLGPGSPDWRSGQAESLLATASDLVGYGLYLDLSGPLRPGQRRHDFALGEEGARVAHALTLASEGRQVALVCSGDPGIYAMAALAFERIEGGPPAWRRIAVTVAPGISALQAAAARAGAPLGHDFCAISLSDLMTPAETIERRLEAAASGDFVVALYNPASNRRRALFLRALEILSRHRPKSTPVILARDLGRPGERVETMRLDTVDPARVDMLTVVLVGSSATRAFARSDGGKWVYTPRGYGDRQEIAKVAP